MYPHSPTPPRSSYIVTAPQVAIRSVKRRMAEPGGVGDVEMTEEVMRVYEEEEEEEEEERKKEKRSMNRKRRKWMNNLEEGR
ncbi:hypothetical protein TRIUR3_27170 [Triticum urartu]|uniref:Uncharacterized protein n=1 Tax=Triticum urartu TaxID=4572 RepID=M8ABD9_TRIUA|nr:hypothetical protein TRIUR3_27170 [Triticum urartu]